MSFTKGSCDPGIGEPVRSDKLVLTEKKVLCEAYFIGRDVYAVMQSGDHLIGCYDRYGNVYSAGSDRKEIGSVIVCNGNYSLIRLSLTEKDGRKRIWVCAEVGNSGDIADYRTYGKIGIREKNGRNFIDENEMTGYGACFVCLQYMNKDSDGYYSVFYRGQ